DGARVIARFGVALERALDLRIARGRKREIALTEAANSSELEFDVDGDVVAERIDEDSKHIVDRGLGRGVDARIEGHIELHGCSRAFSSPACIVIEPSVADKSNS